MTRREHPVQVTIKRYLETVLPAAIVFAIKNETFIASKDPGVRAGVIQRERAAGVRKGFYDLGVLLPDGELFLVEVKDPAKGRLQVEQQDLHKAAAALGHSGCVADCIENVRWALLQFGIAHREPAGQPAFPWAGRVEKRKASFHMDVPF